MVKKAANSEHVIQDVAGCGLFQAGLLVILLLMIKPIVSFSIMFMAFGSYSPGWRCLGNATGSILNNRSSSSIAGFSTTPAMASGIQMSTGTDVTKEEVDDDATAATVYVTGSCDDYEKCSGGDLEFNPETSTMVSEWRLICNRDWILKLIISMQMLGMLMGAYLSGQSSDLIGRKKTLYLGCIACSLSHLISSFSEGWGMFLFFRFCIGLFASTNLIVIFIFVSEFCTLKWRAVAINLPAWYIGATAMSLASWVLKDWRNVDQVACVLNALCVLPLFWLPESLRWLEVKSKSEEFKKVSQKILKNNNKSFSGLENIDLNQTSSSEKQNDDSNNYNVCALFRKGYRTVTFCVGFLQFFFSLLSYAMTFGTKSLYGNFYLNLFVFNMIPIPFCFVSMVLMKTLSRRMHTIVFLGSCTVLSVVSIGILLSDNEEAKDFGSTVLIAMSIGTLDGAWLGVYARNAELYPTVVRGLGMGVGSVSARAGGILAPYLIPNDKSVLYVFMIIVAAIAVVCSFVSYKLPETKRKILKETFDDDNDDDDNEDKKDEECHTIVI